MADVAIWSRELEAGIRIRQKYPGQKNGVPIFLPAIFLPSKAQVWPCAGQGVLF